MCIIIIYYIKNIKWPRLSIAYCESVRDPNICPRVDTEYNTYGKTMLCCIHGILQHHKYKKKNLLLLNNCMRHFSPRLVILFTRCQDGLFLFSQSIIFTQNGLGVKFRTLFFTRHYWLE